jgi:hypothetical protein
LASFDWLDPCDGVVQIQPEYTTERFLLLIVVDPPIGDEMIQANEEVVKNYRETLEIIERRQFYAVKVGESNVIDKFILHLGQ